MKEKLLFAMVMTAILSGCGNGGGNTSDNSHNTKTETPKQVSVSLPPQNSNKQEEYVAATVNHNNELSAAITLDKTLNLVELSQPVAAPILVPAENPLRVKQGEPLIPVVMHQEKPFVQPTIMTQGTPELPVANVAMTPFVLTTKTAQANPELNATRAALTPSLIAHRMNNAITGGGDKYAALAKA
ncbi:hypothetical protein, partial [Motilimonas sp. E26]|uniref:hypothetical protein n=1 Tax=Motilimonas sp. E26 TaxID=2865674 RepID=UPI001E594AC8